MKLKQYFILFSIILFGVSAHLFAKKAQRYPSIQDIINDKKVWIPGYCKEGWLCENSSASFISVWLFHADTDNPEADIGIVGPIGGFDGIKNIPRIKDMQSLQFMELQLKKFPSGIFKDFTDYKKLQRIDISDNDIEEIAPDAFDGLPQDLYFYMGQNKLTSLPENLFAPFNTLRGVNLQENKLQSLPKNLFSPNVKIGGIQLQGNPDLKELPEDLLNIDFQEINLDPELANKYREQLKSKGYKEQQSSEGPNIINFRKEATQKD